MARTSVARRDRRALSAPHTDKSAISNCQHATSMNWRCNSGQKVNPPEPQLRSRKGTAQALTQHAKVVRDTPHLPTNLVGHLPEQVGLCRLHWCTQNYSSCIALNTPGCKFHIQLWTIEMSVRLPNVEDLLARVRWGQQTLGPILLLVSASAHDQLGLPQQWPSALAAQLN